MGEKKVETTESRTIGKLTPEQEQAQRQLMEQAQQAFGQMGDLSGLAAGDLSQLSPAMLAAIQQSQAGARQGIQTNYENEMRNQQMAASGRGIAGSSMEAVGSALLGQGRTQQLANLDAQAAQAQMTMPFQMAQQQMGANQLLGQLGAGMMGQNVGIYSQERLGQGTASGSQTTTGFNLGEIAPMAGAFSGKG